MPKKTVALLVEPPPHYLIALKAHQPTLHRTLARLHQSTKPLRGAETVDTSPNRQVQRRVSVYAAPTALQHQWAGLKTLIWVERGGVRDPKPVHEHSGYSSDLALSAEAFLPHIQQHWSIENQLHWVRAVTFEEDHARPGGNAPVMWAILNCFLLNMVRQLGYRTLPQGIRILANQVKRVFEFLTQGFPPPK